MNARTRRSLTLLWTALFLFSLALQSVTLATPAAVSATPTDGVFQLEGDAVDNGGGDDWANIDAGTDSSQATTGILGDSAGRRFTQGSKDTLDMDDNSWDVGNVPDKDDILHAFAALYDIGGNDTIVFGLDRFANNGDAHAGFWFFQDEIGLNANGTFSGQRTVGDVFILSNFTSGGDLSTVSLYTWTGSGLSAPVSGVECTPASPDRMRDREHRRRDLAVAVPPEAGDIRDLPGRQLLRGWRQPRCRLPERCALHLVLHGRDSGIDIRDCRAQELRAR